MANPFKAVWKGIKFAGKASWHNEELVAAFVPGGSLVGALIKGGISHVDGLIEGGQDPGTGANRRAEAIKWMRANGPKAARESADFLSDEMLAALIDLAIMRRKHPELFVES